MRMRKKSIVVALNQEHLHLEKLSEESDAKRKDQSMVIELLKVTFVTPDLSKDQDHFNVSFDKVGEGTLLMYPDLN